MEVKGKVTEHLPVEEITGGKTKQTFMVQQEGQYAKLAGIIIWDGKLKLPDVGSEVVASVNVESRVYNGKVYTDLKAWKIDVTAAATVDDLGF